MEARRRARARGGFVILFLRSSDIGIDSRLRRYCRGLRAANIPHSALFWNRDGSARGDALIPDVRFVASRHDAGRFTMLLTLLKLNAFALRHMWRNRKAVRLVHAVDLDTVLAAWLFNWLTGTPYIYDIYDNYPDSRGLSGMARKPIDWLEASVIRRAALVILADATRTAQHAPIDPAKLMIVENVPDIDRATLPQGTRSPAQGAPLRIGYLGTFDPQYRGLEDIITVTRANGQVELHLAGFGALEPYLEEQAAACPRIHLHGAMDHAEGLALLANCDIILGLYYLDVPNHRFAAPNKYYEHLLLGKPLLTSLGTPPGSKVRAHDTGWAVADGAGPLSVAVAEALKQPERNAAMGARASALWQRDFSHYFEEAIAGDYAAAVRRLMAHRASSLPAAAAQAPDQSASQSCQR